MHLPAKYVAEVNELFVNVAYNLLFSDLDLADKGVVAFFNDQIFSLSNIGRMRDTELSTE